MPSSTCQVPAYVCLRPFSEQLGHQWTWQDLVLTLSLPTPALPPLRAPYSCPCNKPAMGLTLAGWYLLWSPQGREGALPWGRSGVPCALMFLGVPGFTIYEGTVQGLWVPSRDLFSENQQRESLEFVLSQE